MKKYQPPKGSLLNPLYVPSSAGMREQLATALVNALTKAGFEKQEGSDGELVYARKLLASHAGEDDLRVKVFTSVSEGGSVADVGLDAIRIMGVYVRADGRESPVCLSPRKKAFRVFRVGGVQDIVGRMIDKCREVYKETSQVPRCNKCGAPMARAKSGKLYCADICWEQNKEKAANG